MPKVTQEHREARRAQILEGARRALAKYGYDGATVVRLEEETGLSRGAIFNYFDDKKDIFVALAEDVNRRYIEATASGGFAGAIDKLSRESPEFLAVLVETEVRLYRDPDFTRRMEAGSAELLPKLEAWAQAQRKSGALRTDLDWLDLARFGTMVINGLALRIAGGEKTNVDSVVRLLEDALRPQPGAKR
ncbi:MAG TPA: TetR/AcrR family transcriptional regulator [Gaiellaceae bacterium]|nr:TetR/AcrR family transcriptional regulator [Gaiellaceae bacterium]